MTDVLRMSKKAFTWSVVLVTILWSVGVTALVPMVAQAATCPTLEPGDLFKVPGNSAVYLLNSNMERMYFPTGEVYKTWYKDFSGVVEISNTCVDSYPAPSVAPYGVNYRPGSRLVKVEISPSVYVVEPNNRISKIGSEEVARALYGAAWASLVRDIPDVYWPNYVGRGAEITEAIPHNGQLVRVEGSENIYVIKDGQAHMVEASQAASVAAVTLGGVAKTDVRVISQAVFNRVSMGAGTVTEGTLYADPTQGAGGAGSPAPGQPGTPVSEGSLRVSLSGDTPVAGNLAKGANANMLALNLQAGPSTVKVTKLTLTQVGLSNSTDVENMKIVDAAGLVYGNTVSALNANDTAVFTFPQPLEVPANSVKTVYLRVGVPASGSTTGNSIQFSLKSGADVVTASNATISGSFPFTSSAFGIIGATVGTAVVAQDGTTSDATPDSGDTDVILNKFKVTAGATEDILIESLTFKEAGTASVSDYNNVELWDASKGVSLGQASFNAEGKVHFSGLNIIVPEGKTQRFVVRTDVVSGAGLTMNVDLVEGSSDVLMAVRGQKLGFYLTPTVSNSWNGKGSSDQTINSGSLIITRSAATPAAGNISSGDDVRLAAFRFEAKGEPILVTAVTVSSTLTTMFRSEVTNMVLKDAEGNIVAGPLNGSDAASAGAETAAFSDSFTVPLGQHDYFFEATISDAVSSNDAVLSAIYEAAAVTAKGFNTGDSVTPTGSFSVQGNTLVVNAATLTAVTLTTPAARSVAPGVQDLIWMTGALRANNSGEDVMVETIVLEATLGDAGDDANRLDNFEIWADLTAASSARGDAFETRVSDTQQFVDSAAGDETLSFTLTSQIRVPKNGEVRVAVIGDLASGATAGDTFAVSFDTDAGDVSGTGFNSGATASATPTGAGQVFTVAANGTLTVAVEASYPSTTPKLAYSQQSGVVLAEFNLAANNVEILDLDSFKITDVGSDLAVETYWFYVGNTLLGSVAGGGTAEIFLVDNQQLVPANDDIVVTIKGTMADVDGTTVTDGMYVRPTIAAAGDIDTTGKASGAAVDNTHTVRGPSTTVYGVYPVVTVPAGWDNTNSGNIGAGSTAVGRMVVTAVGDQDLTFFSADSNQLKVFFNTNVQGTSTSKNFILKNVNTGETLDTVSQSSSSTSATFDFSANSLTIPAGQSVTLEVLVDLSQFDASGESIQMYLDDGTVTNIEFGVAGTGSFSHADIIFRGDLYFKGFSRA
ncbi:MAG: hypothetical protein KBD15_00580 [Candidatus Magasanikbacteria bacterium]|jgi:hypothetical protein|nr:hypothetical protein [Candidatus Magasanikbacteria bacterium]